jgi:hypothetical protein
MVAEATSHRPILRHLLHMATSHPSAHHIWIGTWTPTLIADLASSFTSPPNFSTLRQQILSIGALLIKCILDISRLRGSQPPHSTFPQAISTLTHAHSLYPLHLLQLSHLRNRLTKPSSTALSRRNSMSFQRASSSNRTLTLLSPRRHPSSTTPPPSAREGIG